jgi:hypothetical protein
MAQDKKNTDKAAANKPEEKSPFAGTIWDNDLPPGDSPPLPKWPLTLAAVLYGVWMVFLVSMMVMRLIETAPSS